MSEPFSRRLTSALRSKKSALVVGLDPRVAELPSTLLDRYRAEKGLTLEAAAEAVLDFNKGLIEALHDIVVAVKPQLAFYECLGLPGLAAYRATVSYAKEHSLLVITDGKRNDIGSSVAGYADAYLGETKLGEESYCAFPSDSLTVNPYLGSDGITPLVERCQQYQKGIFVLVKTSNPSGTEIQNLDCGGEKVYEVVGRLCHEWGLNSIDSDGYAAVGAVVGATYPAEAAKLRRIMPHAYFLVPGFGAQGAKPQDVVACFNPDGLGAVVNSAREIIFAFTKRGGDYRTAARSAALEAQQSINRALREEQKCAW